MVRTPDSPYKCGRSTEREAWLLKIKRFEDAEAVVLGTYEGMSNMNEAGVDAFGRTKRRNPAPPIQTDFRESGYRCYSQEHSHEHD